MLYRKALVLGALTLSIPVFGQSSRSSDDRSRAEKGRVDGRSDSRAESKNNGRNNGNSSARNTAQNDKRSYTPRDNRNASRNDRPSYNPNDGRNRKRWSAATKRASIRAPIPAFAWTTGPTGWMYESIAVTRV